MFILALDSLEDLETIIEARPDAIVLGIEPFCARTRAVTDWNQLPALVRRMHEAGIQVYINLLAMIEQPRLQASHRGVWTAGEDGCRRPVCRG